MNNMQFKNDIRYMLRGFLLIAVLLNPFYAILLLLVLTVIISVNPKFKVNIALTILAAISGLLFWLFDKTFINFDGYNYLFQINGGRFLLTSLFLIIYFNLHDFIFSDTTSDKINMEKKRLSNAIKTSSYPYEHRVNAMFVGTTRSGKSLALLNIIEYSLNLGEFVCAVSGKNGAVDPYSMYNQLIKLCDKYNRKLYIFSTHQDVHNNFIYNPIKNMTPTEVADVLVSVSPFSEEHYEAAFQSWIIAICEVLKLSNKQISLSNIYNLYQFDKYQRLIEKLFNENKIDREQYLELLEAEDVANTAKDSRSRLIKFVKGDASTLFLDKGLSTKSIKEIRDEKAVVLFDLDGLSYKAFSRELGTLITADLRNVIPKDPDISEHKLIVFDELSVFFSDILPDIYSQASGFKYITAVGTQSFSDLDAVDPTLTERMIENSRQFCFMLQNSASDSQRCADIIGTRLAAEVTNKLDGTVYDPSGSVKVVHEYRVHPNDIRSLKSRESFVYSKDYAKQDLIKVKWDFIKL